MIAVHAPGRMARTPAVSQIGLNLYSITVNSVPATPTFAGLDAVLVSALTDSGTGRIIVTLKDSAKAQQALIPVSIVSQTAGIVASITATTSTTLTIAMNNAAAVAADGAVTIWFAWPGSPTSY